jgi:hypothetical protein
MLIYESLFPNTLYVGIIKPGPHKEPWLISIDSNEPSCMDKDMPEGSLVVVSQSTLGKEYLHARTLKAAHWEIHKHSVILLEKFE